MKLLIANDNPTKAMTVEELISDVGDIHRICSLLVHHLDVRRIDIYDAEDIEFLEPDVLYSNVKSYEIYRAPRTRNKVQIRVRV